MPTHGGRCPGEASGSQRVPRWPAGGLTHPDAGLCEVGPDGDLLAGAHVGVAVALEGGLQLLELLAGEVSPLPPLLLLQGAVLRVGLIRLVLVRLLRVWGEREKRRTELETKREK